MQAGLGEILILIIFLINHMNCDSVCSIQNQYIEDNYKEGASWARQFRDSWGKFPSGVYSGNYFDFGHYDQCINFHHFSEDVNEIKGQYCVLMFSYQHKLQEDVVIQPYFAPDPKSSIANIGIGLCFPHTCSNDEIKEVGNSTLMELMNIQLPSSYQPDLFCSVKRGSFRFNGSQISIVIIFGVIVILIILSTSYEVTQNILGHPVNQLFASFSVYSNSKVMMTMKPFSPKDMIFLHGIRAITIIWIVLGHTHLTYHNLPSINSLYFFEWIKKIPAAIILTGTMGVDTFFLMSSLLLTMSVLRELDRTKRINLLMLYLKRYIRITVPLAAMIFFTITFYFHLSDGPLWNMLIEKLATNFCEKWWWSTLLYVGNFVNPQQLCFGHSWYLLVDMQLYFLSPIILYPLWRFRKHFKVTIPVIFFITSLAMIYVYLIMYLKEFRVALIDKRGTERDAFTYYATPARLDSWMMGIFTGYILYSLDGKVVKFSKNTLTLCWTLCAVGILGVAIGQYPLQQENYLENSLHADAIYCAFRRVCWCLSLAWIVIACHQNCAGFIKKFLSLSIWLPISKLSYCIYLLHLPIQLVLLSSLRQPQHFTEVRGVHKFFGDFGIIFAVAFVFALMFEYPTLRLMKVFLDSRNAVKQNGQIPKSIT